MTRGNSGALAKPMQTANSQQAGLQWGNAPVDNDHSITISSSVEYGPKQMKNCVSNLLGRLLMLTKHLTEIIWSNVRRFGSRLQSWVCLDTFFPHYQTCVCCVASPSVKIHLLLLFE